VIEAIERDHDGFTVAVQWHPESLVTTDAGMMRLFQTFVDAA
jgi:gamma-glutamyl-gamma-aminobutyrate hydrolase PuuD